MKKKVQLSLNSKIRDKAFAYADAHNMTVSALVEKLIGALKEDKEKTPSFINKYLGLISLEEGESVDDILYQAIEEKHLHD